jgi:transcriptional regulator
LLSAHWSSFSFPTELAVPTWNYAAVHAYGVPQLLTDPARVAALLREKVSAYEAGFERPWSGEIPDDYRDKLMHGIVAFELPITRLEGKFKLGQNRPPADNEWVFEALSSSDDPDSRALAQMMITECRRLFRQSARFGSRGSIISSPPPSCRWCRAAGSFH